MKGILRNFKIRDVKSNKNGVTREFQMLDYVVDCNINDKGDVKTYRGSMGVESARKYFDYCGVKTSDLIGKEVGVVLAKRAYEKDGEKRIVNYIKYLNIFDDEGKEIYMPSSKTTIDF